ncbi:MAG: FAD-dependent oxidoreductase [Halieaceae bacterium]|jgi:glycine/D-amino acid oxidase-like deaminating enzyme|nr:FAD-dependent oxidoreductase [Halieaceae bacterium]
MPIDTSLDTSFDAPVDTHRRRALAIIGGSAGAAALAALPGCTTQAPAPRYQRPLSRRPFTAPRISEDRIVREIVGHRPFRPSGFVVRRERFDAKDIIHNYGHGGGGITLAWGSSALAVQQATGLPVGDAAVIGAGIMGLTTARLLQQAGWRVTIYSRAPSRHSVSNVGGGQWAPTSVFDEDVASEAFIAQYKYASRISHHAYQNLVGADYGVSFVENYYLSDEPQEGGYYLREMPELFTSVRDLAPGEHPFPARHVKQTVTMLIEPAMFLRRVSNDFFIAGGAFVARDFGHLDEILALKEATIFNCTGLGAKALFDDEELQPAKGQLVFLPPDPAVDYLTVGGGSDVTYMFSRRGEILLGGSFELGNWSREPDPEITQRIIHDNRAVFDAFG